MKLGQRDRRGDRDPSPNRGFDAGQFDLELVGGDGLLGRVGSCGHRVGEVWIVGLEILSYIPVRGITTIPVGTLVRVVGNQIAHPAFALPISFGFRRDFRDDPAVFHVHQRRASLKRNLPRSDGRSAQRRINRFEFCFGFFLGQACFHISLHLNHRHPRESHKHNKFVAQGSLDQAVSAFVIKIEDAISILSP